MMHPDLGERKQFLLRAIVHDYIATAEPVASQVLVQRYDLQVKSATVRNEMAELSGLGLLRQPHTSAGRIPSDHGYRFYVDRLMPSTRPSLEARIQISRLRQAIHDEIEEVLRQTCRLLTSLTHYTAVAIPPEASALRLREVHLSPLDGKRCLLVLVPTSGEIKHRILEMEESLSAAELTRLTNLINDRAHGLTAEGIEAILNVEAENRPDGIARHIMEAIHELLRPIQHDEALVEGTRQMLHQPEFRDINRLENLLDVLEERRSVLEILRTAVEDHSVQVVIGEEHPEEGLKDCSLVAARYSAGPNVFGAIGVIGPTRMEYSTAVATVQLVAQHLSELFQQWQG